MYACHSLFFFSSRRRHTRSKRDWSSDVCSSDLPAGRGKPTRTRIRRALGALARRGYPTGLAYRMVREGLENEGLEIDLHDPEGRSEERRVGKERRERGGRASGEEEKKGVREQVQ